MTIAEHTGTYVVETLPNGNRLTTFPNSLSPGDLFYTGRDPGYCYVVERVAPDRIDFHAAGQQGWWATPEEFAELAAYCPIDGPKQLLAEWMLLNVPAEGRIS